MIKPKLVGPFDAYVSGYVVPVLSHIGFTKITFTVTMLDLSFKFYFLAGELLKLERNLQPTQVT